MLCRAGAQPGPGATLTGPGPHYGFRCRAVNRLPYLRRDELDHAGQEVWDSIVGSRGGGAFPCRREQHRAGTTGPAKTICEEARRSFRRWRPRERRSGVPSSS